MNSRQGIYSNAGSTPKAIPSRSNIVSTPKVMPVKTREKSNDLNSVFAQPDPSKAIVILPEHRYPDYGTERGSLNVQNNSPPGVSRGHKSPRNNALPNIQHSPPKKSADNKPKDASKSPNRLGKDTSKSPNRFGGSPRDAVPKQSAPQQNQQPYTAAMRNSNHQQHYSQPKYVAPQTRVVSGGKQYARQASIPHAPYTVHPASTYPSLEDSTQRYLNDPRNIRHQNRSAPMPTGMPNNIVEATTYKATTKYGEFEIIDMRNKTQDEIQRMRSTYAMMFQQLNHDWNKFGCNFEMPTRNENIHNLQIRYQETLKFLSSRSGTNMYLIMSGIAWYAIEFAMKYFGLPADNYAKTQLSMYDMYKPQMTEIGISQGVGEDWSPLTKTLVMTMCTAILTVVVNKMNPGNTKASGMVMQVVSGIICGQSKTIEYSEQGTPKPPATGLGGDPMSMLTGILPEGMDMGGIMGTLGSLFGGGGGKKAKKKAIKQKKEVAKEREEGIEEIEFDI